MVSGSIASLREISSNVVDGRRSAATVIPAKAGIQISMEFRHVAMESWKRPPIHLGLDSRFRGNDGVAGIRVEEFPASPDRLFVCGKCGINPGRKSMKPIDNESDALEPPMPLRARILA